MSGFSAIIAAMLFLVPDAMRTTAQRPIDSGVVEGAPPVRITLTELTVTARTVALRYEIGNCSDQDVWICESVSESGPDFDLYVPEGSQTLILRRRFDIPSRVQWLVPPTGEYVRLSAGQCRSESLLLSLPVRLVDLFGGAGRSYDTPLAKQLAIEIDFYRRNPSQVVLDLLHEAETSPNPNRDDGILWGLGGSTVFIIHNETVGDRDQTTIIPYPFQPLGAEHISQVLGRNLSIPYGAAPPYLRGEQEIDLSSCSRIEILYEPSMLHYFFPGPTQQSLLSSDEKEYLRRQKTSVWRNAERIRSLAADIQRGRSCDVAVSGSSARLSCYRGDQLSTHFVLYADRRLLGAEGVQRKYHSGVESLRKFTEEISAFDSRIECAANLKDLWYRLRVDFRAREMQAVRSGGNENSTYPPPGEWCEVLSRAYSQTTSEERLAKPYRCPGAGQGRCHYAMNPNCEPNSPGDMVLLFETKAGWNQHGGPELFTFDNHNPKGGCVLLNDGTVEFIRTEEELHALRWK